MTLKIIMFTYGCTSHLPASRPAVRPGCIRRWGVGGKMEEAIVRISKNCPEELTGEDTNTTAVYRAGPQGVMMPSGHHRGQEHYFRLMPSIWCAPQVTLCQFPSIWCAPQATLCQFHIKFTQCSQKTDPLTKVGRLDTVQ